MRNAQVLIVTDRGQSVYVRGKNVWQRAHEIAAKRRGWTVQGIHVAPRQVKEMES